MISKEIDIWLKATEKIAREIPCDYQLSSSLVQRQNAGGHFAISVTNETYGRAMTFLKMLVKRFLKEGWELSVEGNGRLEPASAVIVEGERIPFKIREKHSRVTETHGKWTYSSLRPNGILAVEFYNFSHVKPAKEYKDTDYVKVEEKIDDIVIWLRRACVQVRSQRLEHERLIETNRERERQRQDLEDRRMRRVDDAKAVIGDFRRYRMAFELREFCTVMQNHLKHLPEGYDKRIQTALEIANWIDPFNEYKDEFLSQTISVDRLMNLLSGSDAGKPCMGNNL